VLHPSDSRCLHLCQPPACCTLDLLLLARAANPHLLELHDFRHTVLAPFILSESQHAEACTAAISHDSSLPQPEGAAVGDEDWNLAGGSAAAGGGAAQAQGGARAAKAKL
jgi:hypothetical protein